MEDAREADKWDVSIDSNIRVPEAVLQDSGRMVRELKKIGDVIGKLLLSTEEIAELCRSYINRLEDDAGSNVSRTSPSIRKWNQDKNSCPWEQEVKRCNADGCGYVEKKTSNNMRHHYLIHHEDITYPIHPFDAVVMDIEEFEKLRKLWKESYSRKEDLRRRAPLRDPSSSKRRCLE